MPESLQGRYQRQTPTRGLLTVNTYCRTRKTDVLSRFLNVDGVGEVLMFRGKLFHAVGPATENSRLPSWHLVRGLERGGHHGLQSGQQSTCDGCELVTGTYSSFIYDGAGPFITF